MNGKSKKKHDPENMFDGCIIIALPNNGLCKLYLYSSGCLYAIAGDISIDTNNFTGVESIKISKLPVYVSANKKTAKRLIRVAMEAILRETTSPYDGKLRFDTKGGNHEHSKK